MFTQAPEITLDATIGHIIAQPTATATSTSTSISTASSTGSTSSPKPTVSTSFTPEPVYYYSPKPEPKKNLSIFGYGAPNSDVFLRGFGISERTRTDSQGYYRFDDIYSLMHLYPEICVQLIDSESRVSQPSCIPAFPASHRIPANIGPILLSPTISISEKSLIGKTIPNTKVEIHFFKIGNYKLPILNTISDASGYFSVNLPQSTYRAFAISKYGDSFSFKSNTLIFSNFLIEKMNWLVGFNYLKLNKIFVILIAEVIVFITLFVIALKYVTKRQRIHSEREYLEEVKELSR